MGVNGDVKQSAAQNRRAKQKETRRGRAVAAGKASWEAVAAPPYIAAIIVASESAGALRLGVTRDGGAFAVGCYAGEDYKTEYIRPDEDWEQAWYDIVEAWWPEKLGRYGELLQRWAQAAR
jgi:hypothetical protein